MKESEWLEGSDPRPMLRACGDRFSQRQMRLFACGCCRLVWPLLTPEGKTAVEVAERDADDRAVGPEASVALDAVLQARERRTRTIYPEDRAEALEAAGTALRALRWQNAHVASWGAARAYSLRHTGAAREASQTQMLRRQADLLRCVVGNPFRQRPTADPRWLTWNDRTAVKMAQAICAERAFEWLPIMADTLEDAGCCDLDILNHCRQAREHALGCWVLDLLLRKTFV
jgi:hypothetical protein